MKRYLTLLFAVVFLIAGVFTFTGCAGNDDNDVDGSMDVDSERNRRWAYDIEQFRVHVIRWHPKFALAPINVRPSNLEMRSAFDNSIDALLDNAPNLSDFEIKVELQRSVALLKDNHFFFTDFIGFRSHNRLLRYPLSFGWFADGFYLYRAYADFAHALNQKLTHVNGVPLDDVFAEFIRFWSVENEYDARYQFAAYLNAVVVLKALGITDGEQTTYTFASGIDITVSQYHIWERIHDVLRWVHTIPLVDARNDGELPLFRQNMRHNLWHVFLPEYGILYVRVNEWVTTADMHSFIYIATNTFEQNNVDAVIIDARGNPGGNSNLYLPLFNTFARDLPEGALFYFVNEGSNSGSLNAAFILENLGATILGQPMAQMSDFYFFGSPYSRAVLHYADLVIFPPASFWSADQIFRRSPEDGIFRPHIQIEYTIDDWINNRDPLFEHVLELLQIVRY